MGQFMVFQKIYILLKRKLLLSEIKVLIVLEKSKVYLESFPTRVRETRNSQYGRAESRAVFFYFGLLDTLRTMSKESLQMTA